MKLADRIVLFVIIIAFALLYFFFQQHFQLGNGRIWDAESYCLMAEQIAEGREIRADKPFVYRVGLPLLLGTFFKSDNTLQLFKAVNFVFGILTALLLVEFLALLFKSRFIVYCLTLLFITNYYSPIRFPAAYPGYVDPPFFLLNLMMIYLIYRWKELTLLRTAALCCISFCAVLVRESALITTVVVVCAHIHTVKFSRTGSPVTVVSKKNLMMGLFPVAAAGFAIYLTHTVVAQTNSFSFMEHMMYCVMAKLQKPWIVMLVPFTTFGPIVLLLLFSGKSSIQQFLKHPVLVVLGIVAMVLAFIGGTASERILFWGHVAFLPLVGFIISSLQDMPQRFKTALFVVMVALQCVAMRIFLEIPDITLSPAAERPEFIFLAPYGAGSHYFHLFSTLMPDPVARIMLFQYAGLLVLFLCVRWMMGAHARGGR